MPKPFFLHRPSGLSCRFLVPLDLRAFIGSRFIVRALYTFDKTYARLLAAILELALSQIFDRLRAGEILDTKKLLSQIDPSTIRKWGADKVVLPGGTTIEGLKIDNEADQKLFNSMLGSLPRTLSVFEPEVVDKGGFLADRISLFLTEKKAGELSEKNLADANFALNTLLLGLCGNKPLNEIDSDDADLVMNALLQWPSNAAKKVAFKGLNVKQILEQAKSLDSAVIAPRTVEKYLDRLRVFFNWCENRYYLRGRNPFANRRLMTKDKRAQTQKKPFGGDELKLIFAPELRETCDAPHKFWCPLIALFSGARVNEIAQLHLHDIYQSGDTWIFKIDTDTPDKKIKNKASERAVPVHQKLIELGFLNYVEDVRKAGFLRLFPNLPRNTKNGYGDAVGDWFNGRYLRPPPTGSKVKRAGIADPEKSFHSFRYVVINRLYAITRERLLVAEITGHNRGDDVLTNVYLDPIDAERRSSTLNELAYPFLSFIPYEKGRFDGYFKRIKRSNKTL